MDAIVKVRGLVKKYGSLTAVDAIDLDVPEGALFAFLGPNGAGKTTTIHIICTLIGMTAGRVFVDGFDVADSGEEVRRRIGVVFQDNVLDDLLTVRENLALRGALYGLEGKPLAQRMEKTAEVMGIDDLMGRRYGKLSGGQRRRAEIARALLNAPKILFLDEPTTGLDPQTRIRVWNKVRELQREFNMTVFLTTHYMEEADGADDVAIIDAGRIVAQGTPNVLKSKYSGDILKVAPLDMENVRNLLEGEGLTVTAQADMLLIPVKDSMQAFSLLKKIEGGFGAFEVARGNMDDVFVNITGHTIREDD